MEQKFNIDPKLIDELAKDNPKVPSNILHALSAVKPSQLMDKTLWDFDTFTPRIQTEEIVDGTLE